MVLRVLKPLQILAFKLIHHLPSKLPRGSSSFQEFADSIFDVYGFPHEDPYYHSIAVMIQHLPPTTVFKSKAWFASSLLNAQAREVAFYKIQEIQKREKEKQAALKEKEIAEVH